MHGDLDLPPLRLPLQTPSPAGRPPRYIPDVVEVNGRSSYKDGPRSHLAETEARQLVKNLRELLPKWVDDFLRMGRWYATHCLLEYRLKIGTPTPESFRSDPIGFLKQWKAFLADACRHVEVRGISPRAVLRRSPEMNKYCAYYSVVDIVNSAPKNFQDAILRCSGSCRILDCITQEAIGEVPPWTGERPCPIFD